VALVTGAARGIGLATARALHDRGASVVLADLDAAQAAHAADAVGQGTLGIAADVTDAAAVQAAVDQTVERFGGLDICVANAGIAPAAATVQAMEHSAFEAVIDVNVLGVYRTVHAALPQVIERAGHVTVLSSIYAFFNGAMMAPYAASKAAVEQLGRALRVELAPHDATAGVAYYGFIDTEMVRKGLEDPLLARFATERVPWFARRRLSPARAAEVLVRGIERRSPRVFAPLYLRPYSAVRGMLNPLIDLRLERDAELRAMLLKADRKSRADAAGEGGVGAAPAA